MVRIKRIIIISFCVVSISSVLHAEQTEQFKKEFAEVKTHYNFFSIKDSMYTMQSELVLPKGFKYIEPKDTLSYEYWLAHFPIWHQYKSIGTWKGGKAFNYDEVSRAVHLPWKGPVFKDVAIPVRILGEYRFQYKQKDKFQILPTKGEMLTYEKWLHGKPAFSHLGDVIFRDDTLKTDTEEEYYKYMLFCMQNVSFESVARSCDSIPSNELQAGDMYIGYNEKGKDGKLFIIMNVISNKAGDKMYLVANGCPEACDMHIQKFNEDRDNPWIDIKRLQSLTDEYEFSNFYRFKL